MKNRQIQGIGLVEIMVTVVVLGIIAAVAAPSFTDMLNRRRVQAVANSIATDLAYLRTEQSVRPSEIDLQVNGNPTGKQMSCYSMFIGGISGNTCDCTNMSKVCTGGFVTPAVDPLIRVERTAAGTGVTYAALTAGAVFNGNFKYDSARLSPSPANLYFDVCGSSASSTRPILRVEFNSVGRARVCSPNGSVSGYGQCTQPVVDPKCL